MVIFGDAVKMKAIQNSFAVLKYILREIIAGGWFFFPVLLIACRQITCYA